MPIALNPSPNKTLQPRNQPITVHHVYRPNQPIGETEMNARTEGTLASAELAQRGVSIFKLVRPHSRQHRYTNSNDCSRDAEFLRLERIDICKREVGAGQNPLTLSTELRRFRLLFSIAPSSNGKTADSGSAYRGSNPCGAARAAKGGPNSEFRYQTSELFRPYRLTVRT